MILFGQNFIMDSSNFDKFTQMAKTIKNIPPKKKRANKYDEKLAINGTFAEVFKVVKKNKEDKKKM
jgi:hypothetical protein